MEANNVTTKPLLDSDCCMQSSAVLLACCLTTSLGNGSLHCCLVRSLSGCQPRHCSARSAKRWKRAWLAESGRSICSVCRCRRCHGRLPCPLLLCAYHCVDMAAVAQRRRAGVLAATEIVQALLLLRAEPKQDRLRVGLAVAAVAPGLLLRAATRAPAVGTVGLQLDAVRTVGGHDGRTAAE